MLEWEWSVEREAAERERSEERVSQKISLSVSGKSAAHVRSAHMLCGQSLHFTSTELSIVR